MRALTVRQPWASLIMRGLKTAEYRAYRIPKGELAIHAGRALPTGADVTALAELLADLGGAVPEWQQAFEWCQALLRGLVLGTVRVTGHGRAATRWGEVANLLADPCEWERPVRARGQQGLWDWEPVAESPGLFDLVY